MAFNPQALAQALASQPKEAPRSKYLEQALKSMEAGGQNIQGGGGELAARLLAQAITQRAYKKASTEERAAERERQASIMSTLNLGGMVAPTGAAQPQPQAPMSAPPAPVMPPTAIGPGMDGEPIGPPPAALAAAIQPQQPPEQAQPAMAPPAQGGLPSYRDAAPALLAASLMGAPEASMIGEILQGAAPQLKDVNGMILDMSDPRNTGRYVPQFDKGQEPLFDQRGNVVGVRNMDGSVQSAAEMAGAVSRAQESAKAGFDLVEVPLADGTTRMVPRDQAIRAMGGQSAPVPGGAPLPAAAAPGSPTAGAPPAGFGVRQSPAQQRFDVMQAEALGEARGDVGRVEANAMDTLNVINMIRNHPGRAFGTGATGVIPGIPGTAQKDFIDLVEQAKGKAFLEAFNSLKGGGQITEKEGQAAQAALARLNRTQSEEGFMQALADYERVIRTGLERAQQKAGATGASRPPPPTPEQAREILRQRGVR